MNAEVRNVKWFLATNYRLISSALYDIFRFIRFSSVLRKHRFTRNQCKAQLTAKYHSVEKGLSLRNPRHEFGKPLVADLKDQLRKYKNKFGEDEVTFACSRALHSYDAFNQIYESDFRPDQETKQLQRDQQVVEEGATISCNKSIDIPDRESFFEAFAISRHSCRDFSDEKIDPDKLGLGKAEEDQN